MTHKKDYSPEPSDEEVAYYEELGRELGDKAAWEELERIQEANPGLDFELRDGEVVCTSCPNSGSPEA